MYYLSESLFPKGQSCRAMCLSRSKSGDNPEVPVSGWCVLAPDAGSFKVRTPPANLLNFAQTLAVPSAHSIRFMTRRGRHVCAREVDLVYLFSLCLSASTRDSAAGPTASAQSRFSAQGDTSVSPFPGGSFTLLTTSLGATGRAHNGQSGEQIYSSLGISLFLLTKSSPSPSPTLSEIKKKTFSQCALE